MNNNLKRIMWYIIYIAVFGFLIVAAGNLDRHFMNIYRTTYQTPYLWLFLVQFVFPFMVGLGLALPQFIVKCRQKGFWKVDWIVFLTVSLPTFIVAVTPAAFFSLVHFIVPETGSIPIPGLISFIGTYPALNKAAGMMSGFFLLTSLVKAQNHNI
jgi:hypothetical protein